MEPFSFPIAEEQLLIGDFTYRICHAADSETLFNELLQLPDDHPAIKDEQIPYWAELWPSAIGLAGFLIEQSERVKDKSVLEIGCGLGLPGIVAGRTASTVVLTDYLNDPVRMAALNWKLNHGTAATTALLDWRSDLPAEKVDVLLASDVAYERRMFDSLMECFNRFVKDDGIVIISEPDRHFARDFFKNLPHRGWTVETTTQKIERKSIGYRVNIHVLSSSK